MIFSKFENLLKTISDDSIQHPKGHPSIPGKYNFSLFRFWQHYINIIYNGQNRKNEVFNFVPELKDHLWDVEYYHH